MRIKNLSLKIDFSVNVRNALIKKSKYIYIYSESLGRYRIKLPLNRLLEETNRVFYRNETFSVFKRSKVCNFGHQLS